MVKKKYKVNFIKKFKSLNICNQKKLQIKLYFVTKDLNEKGLRMILNFGHTFPMLSK